MAGGGTQDRRAWVLGGLLAAAAALGVAAAVLRGAPAPVVPAMGSAAASVSVVPDLPELAALPPKERFAELFDRMMRAGVERDSMTIARLAPLAVAAYGQLDSLDADTRFHAALIAIQLGDLRGARALADTIEQRDPGHLFGPIILGALARLANDTAGFNANLVRIKTRADSELARTDRPEYAEHAALLTEVRNAVEIK